MANYRQSPFANLTPVVKYLIIINVIFFVATMLLKQLHIIDLDKWFPAYYFNSPNFRPWQIITYMFMHGGWGHIFSNMFALFIFGPTLEYTIGSKRFFNLYFITGLGALAAHMLVWAIQVHQIIGVFTVINGDISVFYGYPAFEALQGVYSSAVAGASGAVFGILVAFAMLFPNTEMLILFLPFPIKAKYLVSGYILFELFSGVERFSGDNIAHFAHLGGALFGYIMVKFWGLQRPNNFFN